MEPQGWCFQVESLPHKSHQKLLEEEVWRYEEQLAPPIPQEQFMVEPSPQAQPQVLVQEAQLEDHEARALAQVVQEPRLFSIWHAALGQVGHPLWH